ncbi:olfactory receptor 10C1-like [Pseudopipra pipra]|uniref:olfactory receptor 10C1-like n=1 Tax=Pseudopipra pipra TaxID=415032 RepID=UPI003139ABDB
MILGNFSEVSEFRLLGFSEISHLHPLLFVVLLSLYILTLMANAVIALTMNGDNTLHSPMYFFLTQLSCLDICYLSVIIPNILENLMVGTIGISKARCATQMFFFLFFGVAECFLLAAMSLDRYVAICCPLHYTIVMNSRVCKSLVAGTYICGAAVGLVHTIITFNLPFCGFAINHFFCEIQPLLDLLCGNTFPSEIQVIVVAVFAILCPFLLIIYSYSRIISTILLMSSAESQQKAFSTCSSHLLVVILFYGTVSSMYLRPKYTYSASVDKFLSLSYSVVTPLLNPTIYSWRNEEVKRALRKKWRNINLVWKCNRIFALFQMVVVVFFTVNSCSVKGISR